MNKILNILMVQWILYLSLSNCLVKKEIVTLSRFESDYRLYNLSKFAVRNTDQDDVDPSAYGSSLAIDGDMTTFCWAKSFWTVHFLRSYTGEEIFIQGFARMTNFPTISILNSKTNEATFVQSNCRFMDDDQTTALCPVERVVFDTINITGSRIMFYEVIPRVSSYINVTGQVLEISSTFNSTRNCFTSIFTPKIEVQAWCCVNLTLNLYLNGEGIIEAPFTETQPSYAMSRCFQSTELVEVNLTSQESYISYQALVSPPNVTQEMLDIPRINVESINMTSGLLQVSRWCSLTYTTCIPFQYLEVKLSSQSPLKERCLPDNQCKVLLGDLEPETSYTVEVTGSRHIADIEYYTRTTNYTFSTLPCSSPEPVTIGEIRKVLSLKSSVEIRITFKAGDTRCLLSNTTYMLTLVSDAEVLVLVCRGSSFCGAVVKPFAKYNITITTINSAGMESNRTKTWTSPEISPTAPINITASIKHDNAQYSALIHWSPPAKPNGLIRAYHLRYHSGSDWRTTLVPGNMTSYTIDVQPYYMYKLELVAETVKIGVVSSTMVFNVPPGEMPNRPEYFTQTVHRVPSKKCVMFQWSSASPGSSLIEYKVICQPQCLRSSKFNCTIEPTLRSLADGNSSRTSICGFADVIDYLCKLMVRNYYGEEELSLVVVTATYSDEQVVTDTPMRNEITLIAVGVAIVVLIIAASAIIGLCFRHRRSSRESELVPLTDDDAWLMSDQSGSTSLSGDNIT